MDMNELGSVGRMPYNTKISIIHMCALSLIIAIKLHEIEFMTLQN